jgi:hypothetical protein
MRSLILQRYIMMLILKLILGFIVGIVAGFFTVFNYVFTDSNGQYGEQLFTFVIVIALYAVLGFAAAFLYRGKPILSAAIVSTPAMFMLILYLLKEPGLFFLSALYVVATAISTYAGAYLKTLLFRKTI